MKLRIFFLASLIFLAAGCGKPKENPPAPPAQSQTAPAISPASESPSLADRGKSVYMAQCISCHAPNPYQDGPLGPSVAGSNKDLIAARVLRASYPEGYTPKRTTQVMVALPHLEADIDALAAFLNRP